MTSHETLRTTFIVLAAQEGQGECIMHSHTNKYLFYSLILFEN